MRLSSDTVLFKFGGVPILGSWTSGHVIGLTQDGLKLCERMRVAEVSKEDIAAVDSRFPDALVRGAFLQDSQSPKEMRGKSAYVHVTQRCNLSCLGCYSLDEKRNCLADASVEQFTVAFEKLARAGFREIIVSGGEPFLRHDLPEICESAKQCGIAGVTVITNGTLVTERALSRLAPFVDCVSVSFDGVSQEDVACIRGVQRFDRLVEAIRLIKAAGMRAHMIPTIHCGNYRNMGEYLRLSEELGASLNFSLLSCCDPDAAEFKDLVPGEEDLAEMGCAVFEAGKTSPVGVLDLPVGSSLSIRRNCGAARNTLSVDADGAVYPCHMLHYPELDMGNAFADAMDEILESPVAIELANLEASIVPGCAECDCSPFCGGGCRARAYAQSRTIDAHDPYCAMTREFYRCLERELSSAYTS